VGDTQEEYPDMDDYEMLLQATQQKMKLLTDDESDCHSSTRGETRADEFLRNFFIKFGMKKTLEQFQTEWYELKATNELDIQAMPEIPKIYQRNQELSDELAVLQEELDEARIIAEKARSTYDKLRKQRDFQKINHRRVQQEKSKLNTDSKKNETTKSKLQQELDSYVQKYEITNKEKMLMRLEKDRLVAKVDSLHMEIN
jgi:sperm-associated antigen 16 protein